MPGDIDDDIHSISGAIAFLASLAALVVAVACFVIGRGGFGFLALLAMAASLALGVKLEEANSPEGRARRRRRQAEEEAEHQKRLADLAEKIAAAERQAAEHARRALDARSPLVMLPVPVRAKTDSVADEMQRHFDQTLERRRKLEEIRRQVIAEFGFEKSSWPQYVIDEIEDLEELIAKERTATSRWGRGRG